MGIASPSGVPDVSVIVSNWNGSGLLRDCLQSIYDRTRDVAFQVIVVDDASTDDSAAMVRSEFPGVTLIVNERNVGFARANNLGAEHATGRFVLLLNSDTVLINNAIKVLVQFLDEHPDVPICGGCLVNADHSMQISYGSFPTFFQALVDALFLNDLFPRTGLPNRGSYPPASQTVPRKVDFIIGADILIRKDVIDRMGLFDEEFGAYCEEVDFCYRATRESGKNVYYVPDARIVHLGGMSYGNLGERQIRLTYRGYDRFLRKHHGGAYAVATRLLYAWHHGVKLCVRSAAWLLSSAELKPLRKRGVLNAWTTVRVSLRPNDQPGAQN